MKLCAVTVRVMNLKFTREKWLTFLPWKGNSLGFGLSANVVKEVFMKMYYVPGVFSVDYPERRFSYVAATRKVCKGHGIHSIISKYVLQSVCQPQCV